MSTLIIICGLSFAGKSTLGDAIAKRFAYEQVDVDITKLNLYGQDAKDEQLTQSDWDRIYGETDNLILNYLHAGKNVIDASRNFRKIERQHIRALTKTLGADVVTIHVDTPEVVARQRLHENRLTRTRVDHPDAAFNEIVNVMEPSSKDETPLVFAHDGDMEEWIVKNMRPLSNPRHLSSAVGHGHCASCEL